MKNALSAATVASLICLAACGGEALNDPVLPPGTPGTATVGPAGGSVQATLAGGGSVALTIPAGALADPVTVTIEPAVAPPGTRAAFLLSPAGLRLAHPATLVIQVPQDARVETSTVLTFVQDGHRIPMASTPDVAEGRVTVALHLLGLPATAADPPPAHRAALVLAQSQSSPPANGNLANLSLDERIVDALAALGQLERLGTVPAADAMKTSMEAVLQMDPVGAQADPRFPQLVSGWRDAVCDDATFAVNTLQSFGFASDYRGLERVAGQVIGWALAVDDMTALLVPVSQPGCPAGTPDAETAITTKLASLAGAIAADLASFAVLPSPQDSVFLTDRIAPLLDLIASLRLVNFLGPAGTLLGLVSAQVERVRVEGYNECRLQHAQNVQGRLIRSEAVGGVFAAVSTFDQRDLESDIELCGMDIAWRLMRQSGAIVASGRLGGGDAPSVVFPPGTATIDGDGNLELSGNLQALRCPAPASANAEQLEVLAGATTASLVQLSVLTPANNNTYLQVSPLVIPATALRNAAGISPTGVGLAQVMLTRTGGTCSGLFANLGHSPLGTLAIQFQAPSTTIATGAYDGTVVRTDPFETVTFQARYWLLAEGSQFYVVADLANQPPPPFFFPHGKCASAPSETCSGLFTLSPPGGTFQAADANEVGATWSGSLSGGVLQVVTVRSCCGVSRSFNGTFAFPFP